MTRALAFKQLQPIAGNYLAFSFFKEGDIPEAIRHYQRTIAMYRELLSLAAAYHALPATMDALNLDFSDVYIALGVCYQRQGKAEESLAAYRQAIETHPRNSKAYFNRAVIFWERKEWQHVIAELEQALALNPNYTEASYYLQKARQNMNAGTTR